MLAAIVSWDVGLCWRNEMLLLSIVWGGCCMPIAAIPTVIGLAGSRVELDAMLLVGQASDPGMLLVCTVSE